MSCAARANGVSNGSVHSAKNLRRSRAVENNPPAGANAPKSQTFAGANSMS